AWRLVSKEPRTTEVVVLDRIGHGLQSTRVERARGAIAAVSAAVEEAVEVERRNAAGLADADLAAHQHRVTTAMAPEHLFTRQRNLDRTTGQHRHLGGANLVIERIALAAKAATVGTCNDPNAIGRQRMQHTRERPMQVVRRLRRRPNRQLAVLV